MLNIQFILTGDKGLMIPGVERERQEVETDRHSATGEDLILEGKDSQTGMKVWAHIPKKSIVAVMYAEPYTGRIATPGARGPVA